MHLDRLLRIKSPPVEFQIIDDEAILIHFDSGAYYSANPSATLILDAIARGLREDRIAAWFGRRYPTADAAQAVRAFTDILIGETLVVEQRDALREQCTAPEDVEADEAEFEAPALEKFNDLESLLVLDPVHDVDAAGWPVKGPQSDPA